MQIPYNIEEIGQEKSDRKEGNGHALAGTYFLEQLQMGIAVCSLLTVMLLIVTLHKINRIQRYIQKKQTGTDRMESAEFGSAFPAEGVSQCEEAAEGAKKYPADMLIDEVIEEVVS